MAELLRIRFFSDEAYGDPLCVSSEKSSQYMLRPGWSMAGRVAQDARGGEADLFHNRNLLELTLF